MKCVVLAFLFVLMGCASFSAQVVPTKETSSSLPAKLAKPVIGTFKNPRYEIAGCWFFLPADYRRPDAGYIFFTENFTEARMKIDGKEIQLTLAQQSPRNYQQKIGRKTWEVYRHESVEVRIDQTLIRRHSSGASSESLATFTITRGTQKQTLQAKGSCGC